MSEQQLTYSEWAGRVRSGLIAQGFSDAEAFELTRLAAVEWLRGENL